MSGPSTQTLEGNPGAEWIDRYLAPRILNSRLKAEGSLRCLQIGPDDDEEAQRLRQKGHRCAVMLESLDPYRAWRWHETPVVSDWRAMPFEDSVFDLIFTPWFGKLAGPGDSLPDVARALYRVLRPGGAMLLSVSNRWCPLDLVDRRLSLPGTTLHGKLALSEIESAFEGLDVRIVRQNVRGHFRWGRLPRAVSWAAPLLNGYLGACSSPGLRPVYGSPLNPLLMLWVERGERQ